MLKKAPLAHADVPKRGLAVVLRVSFRPIRERRFEGRAVVHVSIGVYVRLIHHETDTVLCEAVKPRKLATPVLSGLNARYPAAICPVIAVESKSTDGQFECCPRHEWRLETIPLNFDRGDDQVRASV
jgi:hypothetical protein